MFIHKIASFSNDLKGGNPAGVVVSQEHPSASEMQKIAADVGYSETAFAMPVEGENTYRVRYFSPESEVPFCGHATIALGAVLASQEGDGIFKLVLNETDITVEGRKEGALYSAALQSPKTFSGVVPADLLMDALNLFGYTQDDLDMRIPPAMANAGAQHLIIALSNREKLSSMTYDLDQGRVLFNQAGLVTISLIFIEDDQVFHVRNPFASGGVLEEPSNRGRSCSIFGLFTRYRLAAWWQDNTHTG